MSTPTPRPSRQRHGLLTVLFGLCLAPSIDAAPASGPRGQPGAKETDRPPPPALSSLPAPKAAGPLRVLLVDDDVSGNNVSPTETRLSSSDTLFRALATRLAGSLPPESIVVVEQNKHGPSLEQMRPYNLVLWYNGMTYGGAHDKTGVMSLEDEKAVRAYLEQVGGTVVLFSPGYLSNHSYGSTWASSPHPFLGEVVGIDGIAGLVQRFRGADLIATDGTSYAIPDRGVVETAFSAANPKGAAILFRAQLPEFRAAKGPAPVALAHAFGGGRFVYVGFPVENVPEEQRDAVIQRLIEATGLHTSTLTPPPPLPTAEPALLPAPIAGVQILPGIVATGTTVATAPAPQPAVSVSPILTERPLTVTDTVRNQILKPAPAMRDVDFDNWGFEHGLTGWNKTGTAFDSQPTYGDNVGTERVLTAMEYNQGGLGGDFWKNQGYPNGYKGRFWIGTYERNPGGAGSTFGATQGDGPTGTLTSPEFQVTQAHCYFLIGGGSDARTLRVELQVRQPDGSWQAEATRTSFRNSELMHRESFALGSLQGHIARIQIVDEATGAWGHVNVDDFHFRNEPLDTITLTDRATGRAYQVDADVPVWGIADTHAHPAHNNGFGNKLILGRAHDPLSTTYSTTLCRVYHGGGGHLNTVFIGGADVHPIMQGWPDFVGFPRFNSKTHQQQHVEFMKRAWQGGMRLISALAVNNMYLPSLALGPGHDGQPYDDDSVTLRQIQELKEIAASQSDWLEIAYTPKDARRIIAQGKCAMVLGVEVDNFGNFKVSSYNWNDGVNPANVPLTSLTASNAEELLTRKIQQYHDLGVRQVTPLHYLTGTFGGAAVFRGQIALIQFAFNNRLRVKEAIERKIPYSLRDDYDASMIAAGHLPADYLVKIEGAEGAPSTINASGMSDFGRLLMRKLMDQGMLVDSEHMGYDTKEELFALAAQRNYPVMSSHTDPAALCHNWVGAPVAFQGTREDKMRNFGTTNIRNIATEFTLADEHYEKIKHSGGTVGVFMLPYLKHSYRGYLGSVANDCAGSTKTFAQMYLHSLDRMDQQGVGLATDRGMTDFIAPRFGPQAGFTLAPETMLTVKRDLRRTQRLSQANGVRYDRPMGSFHASWYHQTDAESIDEFENDAWIAFAAIEANVPSTALPDSAYVLHAHRIRNYVRGFNAPAESALEAPTLFNGDTPWQQAAMYCLRHDKDPSALAAFRHYNAEQQNRLRALYIAIRPAWQAWNRKYGNNAPLRRFRTGNRDWDFNTDGMAHYGLMPDFLQDLRNIGISPGHLTPLFRSAEDYIKMWEKASRAAVPKS
jgi:microsomal dipeptidase-like Zn-dependent dipeptidase